MTRDKWLTWLEATVLGFLLSFGAVACLVSGYAMDGGGHGFATELSPVDMAKLAKWCALVSFLFGGMFLHKVSSWLVPIGLVALILWHWFYGDLAISVEAVLYTVSLTCDRAYGWGQIVWNAESLIAADRTVAFCVLAALVAAVAIWVVCRGRRSFWAIGAALLPLLVCTLVTDRVPNEKYLFVWLAGIGVLVLTQTVRRQSQRQGNALTALISIPLVLALMLLFHQVPQEGYQEEYRADALLQQFQSLFQMEVNTAPVGVSVTESVDLTMVGMRSEHRAPRMDVTTDTNGVFYLRGEVYDVYTGTDWKNSGNSTDLPWPDVFTFTVNNWNSNELPVMDDSGATGNPRVHIHTRYAERLYYTPYYTMDVEVGPQGLKNPDRETDYSFSYVEQMKLSERALDEAAFQRFTELPESTRQWAEPMVVQILGNSAVSSSQAIPQIIANYVSNSARYDLQTPRMDRDYGDFAQWFLTRSETGYCVHFATSTVVLLRAAGIPARYVTGYMFQGEAGETVTVTTMEAHAWVEYWTTDSGWQILESTPAAEEPEPPEESTEPVTDPEETTTEPPATTEPPVQKPTEPSQNTGETPKPGVTPKQEENLSWLWTALLWVLVGILIPVAVYFQYRLRRDRKYRRRNSGKHNKRAIESYKQLQALYKLTHAEPEETCMQLALKAKFSQHRLEKEELQTLEAEVQKQQALLREHSWYHRLIYKLIFAAY